MNNTDRLQAFLQVFSLIAMLLLATIPGEVRCGAHSGEPTETFLLVNHDKSLPFHREHKKTPGLSLLIKNSYPQTVVHVARSSVLRKHIKLRQLLI